MEVHPGVDHTPPVVPIEPHFFSFVRLDLDRQPPVILAVEFREQVGGVRIEGRGLALQEVLEHPALWIVELPFESALASSLQESVGGVGVVLRAGRGACAQLFGEVAGRPHHEPVECLFDRMLVRQFFELVVLDRIRGITAQHAVSEEDHWRDNAFDVGSQIELAVHQLDLETIQTHPLVSDLPDVYDLSLPEGLVAWRGAKSLGALVACLLAGTGQWGRHRVRDEADEPPDEERTFEASTDPDAAE